MSPSNELNFRFQFLKILGNSKSGRQRTAHKMWFITTLEILFFHYQNRFKFLCVCKFVRSILKKKKNKPSNYKGYGNGGVLKLVDCCMRAGKQGLCAWWAELAPIGVSLRNKCQSSQNKLNALLLSKWWQTENSNRKKK